MNDSMRYIDFVDLKYEPKPDDLICEFHLEPQGSSIEVAAGGVAAESSVGTWTELRTIKNVKKLRATVFGINGQNVKIAYPLDLFEMGNMPNILSSVAGNVFGLAAIKNLRLNDVWFPERLVKSFKGPKYGIEGIRRVLRINERPLLGTIIKPKLGLDPDDHAKIAYEAWSGGCDFVKDDENLANQKFNRFAVRLRKTLKMRDRAEKETGARKMYLINITAETDEMLKRAQLVKDIGGEYVMVDILTCGFSSIQSLRNKNLGLVLHAHRAGHASFTRNPRHGISMKVISKIVRIVGFDQLHVGAVVGKMSEIKEDVLQSVRALKEDLYGLRGVLPVASGGLHPSLVPPLMKIFGKDVVIQAGGGIHGHKNGTLAGARAMRQAVEATLEGRSLKEYATSYKELKEALATWSSLAR